MPTPAQIQYIQQRSAALGLDPEAVLAIAGHEGLSGGIGDGGHAFGPFQENNAGGVLTGKFQGMTPQQINQWAWSNQGIDSALGQIAGVARGLKGQAAIRAITTRFERPANPGAEIADATAHYGRMSGGNVLTSPGPGKNVLTQPQSGNFINAGGAAARQQLLQQVMGNRIDFNSNQVQVPQLLQLALARQQTATGAPTPSGRGAAPAPAGGPAPRGWKPGSPVGDLTSRSGEHPTEGLAGYPAYDYFAPSGSAAVAPITGRVVRLSGHDPSQGPIEGPHGPLGWSVYIQGNDGHTYYLTHMGSRSVQVGQTVRAGQPIGTVADYAKYGTPSHIHMGVH